MSVIYKNLSTLNKIYYCHLYIYIYIYIHWLRSERFGIEFRWGRDFPPVQTGPEAHSASCTMGIGSLPEVKCGRGVLLTTHSLLVPRSWKSRAIPLPSSGLHRACNGITLPFYLYINIYYRQVTQCLFGKTWLQNYTVWSLQYPVSYLVFFDFV